MGLWLILHISCNLFLFSAAILRPLAEKQPYPAWVQLPY
jgi:hypothetical protein